jgi:hypothetical protein
MINMCIFQGYRTAFFLLFDLPILPNRTKLGREAAEVLVGGGQGQTSQKSRIRDPSGVWSLESDCSPRAHFSTPSIYPNATSFILFRVKLH